MRTTHLFTFFVLLMAGALGASCGEKVISVDDDIKAHMIGNWNYEYKDRFDRTTSGTFHMDASGRLAYSEKVIGEEGEMNEHGEGEWFVTSGLLKHKTTQINGKKLGSLQTGFFTCRLANIQPSSFTCHDDVKDIEYIFRKS